MNKSSSDQKFNSRNIRPFLQNKLQHGSITKAGSRLGALLVKSRSKKLENTENSSLIGRNVSEGMISTVGVLEGAGLKDKQPGGGFSNFQKKLLQGSILSQLGSTSQFQYLKKSNQMSPSGKYKKKGTGSFEHLTIVRSPTINKPFKRHVIEESKDDIQQKFIDAGTGSQESRLNELKNETLKRIAESNKNHMNPYIRRSKAFSRKLSRGDSKESLLKSRYKHDLELPDIYAKKQKKEVSTSLSALVSQDIGEFSRYMRNNNSVSSLSMALHQPQIPSQLQNTTKVFQKRSTSHAQIQSLDFKQKTKPRFTASMLSNSPKSSSQTVKKQTSREIEETPLTIKAHAIAKPKEDPPKDLFRRNSKYIKHATQAVPKKMTRNMSHPALQTKETKEMKDCIDAKEIESPPKIEEPVIQFETLPSMLTPDRPLQQSKSRDDEMFETHLSHIMRQNSEKNTRSNSQVSFTQPILGITKWKVISRGGLGAFGSFKLNQDAKFMVERFMDTQNSWLMGVCDGHGSNGHHVSQFVVSELPRLMKLVTREELKGFSRQELKKEDLEGKKRNSLELLVQKNGKHAVTRIFEEAFKMTNSNLGAQNYDVSMSGTTVCTALIVGNSLFTSNVGDTRAVLGRLEVNYLERRDSSDRIGRKSFRWKPIRITRDHKPDEEPEYSRIIANNGRVEALKGEVKDYSLDSKGKPIGPMRVWLKDDPLPGLAMSRSFGDRVATLAGVISTPEVKEFELQSEDKFIIIASDGVWEYISDEEAIKIISRYWNKRDVNMACQKIVEEARLRWKHHSGAEQPIDDITAIIAFLGRQ